LVNLLLTITVTTTLTAIGNYYLDKKDIQEHLDTLMAVAALSYQALLGDDIKERQLPNIQKKLNQIPKQVRTYFEKPYIKFDTPDHFLDKFSFQIWTNSGKLLLQSSSAPKLPLMSETDGFNNKTLNDQQWRVFTTYNQKAGIRTVLGERFDTRDELGQRIAQDDLYIMLLTFPLSGLLIWIIIGRGLDSLDRVAEEVANRAPNHLEPVNIDKVPDEIKPVVDELNKLFFRLKEAFEREKRFAADAAHELRTPLAALKAQAQVALNIQDIDEKNNALQKLIVSVNRSTHIVQQLLTMSKLVPESATINDLDTVELGKIAREVIAMQVPNAVEKNIELELFDAPSTPSFPGNSTAISILIRNLVDNAIRYSQDGGSVKVKTYANGNFAVLEVKDDGPGIPDELSSRVFERFFRVIGNKSPGSGLGLAIVHQICALHNGTVKLDKPTDGTGLIVRAIFPTNQQPL
tara:strand:+ start:703 stop:2091 length:1389 start_codon:yes stop_codon:yes gene_type:complete